MYIVHVSSELAQVAKVGGLADVVFGLSKALVGLGHSVEVILPKYDCLTYAELKDLRVSFRELWCTEGTTRYNNSIWEASLGGLKLLLVEPHHPKYYFSRGVVYGCHDDIDRFVYFSRVVMEYLSKSGKRPDVVHVHDWPTALIPVLHKELYSLLPGHDSGMLMTIHNMQYQGKCHPLHLTRMGLDATRLLTPSKMQDPFAPGLANLLKGSIVYADRVTTVSPNYAKELQTIEGGFGLHKTLRAHAEKFKGILNGIDDDYWNPEKDPHLIKRYATSGIASDADLEGVLRAKEENKKHLRTHCTMEKNQKPLIACVTRLVPQKAPKLIKHALLRSLDQGAQFFLLGSSPTPSVQMEFEKLKTKLSSNKDVALMLDYDEALAHLAYAAADLFIIPSLFEPCGLTQMIAMRYGTIPIARMTGGLVDTVFDVDTSSKPEEERNGFTFDYPDTQGINWALDRAIACFVKEPKRFRMLIGNGMRSDFSWKHSAPEYVEIYRQIQPAAPVAKAAP